MSAIRIVDIRSSSYFNFVFFLGRAPHLCVRARVLAVYKFFGGLFTNIVSTYRWAAGTQQAILRQSKRNRNVQKKEEGIADKLRKLKEGDQRRRRRRRTTNL